MNLHSIEVAAMRERLRHFEALRNFTETAVARMIVDLRTANVPGGMQQSMNDRAEELEAHLKGIAP